MSGISGLFIIGLVLAARLVLPLFIFRFPLPGILACLVVDAVDQTVFQQLGLELAGYQSYDKALDVFYLTMAYLAMLRNWRSGAAFTVARFLFYYRLVGSAVFELSGAEHRFLLLVFPNTFEYFFICYELVRVRWDPRRRSARFWYVAAAVIWIFVKLPQETWIHVLQLDFTDVLSQHPALGVAIVAAAAAFAIVWWRRIRPALPPADHPPRFVADPVPAQMSRWWQRDAVRTARGRVFDLTLLEKVVLTSIVTMIFASIIPSVTASPLQITVSVAILVLISALLGLWRANRNLGFDDLILSFGALAAVNTALVLTADILQPGRTHLDVSTTLYFVQLLTLIVTLYDRYRPVHEVLVSEARDQEVTLVTG